MPPTGSGGLKPLRSVSTADSACEAAAMTGETAPGLLWLFGTRSIELMAPSRPCKPCMYPELAGSGLAGGTTVCGAWNGTLNAGFGTAVFSEMS